MIKNIILVAILLVVHTFFIGLFLMGGYHNLKKLRDRCLAAHSAEEYEQAAKEYNAERNRFPSFLAALLFRFRPSPPSNELGADKPRSASRP